MTQEQRVPEKARDTKSTPSKLKRAWIWSAAILLVIVALLVLLEPIYRNLNEKGWTTYTREDSGLVSILINALAMDEEGRVWVGTWLGLSMLAPDGSWTSYTSRNSGLASGRVLTLAIDQMGAVIIGTRPGLSRLAPDGSWTSYTSGLLSNDVNELAFDAWGGSRLWVGTRPGLSVLLPGFRSTTYTSENSGLVHNSVQALVIDERYRVWVGTSGGLSVLGPPPHESWTSYTSQNSALVDNSVQALAIDEGGRVWVGSWLGGLSVLAPDGSWTTYTSEDSGLVDNSVQALAIDEAGHIWVGTSRGLSQFDEGASASKSILQPLATVITFLMISRTLAAWSLVIITVGIIRRRRKPTKAPALEPASLPAAPALEPDTSSVPATQAPSDPQSALAEGKTLLGQGKKDEAIAFLMHAFREGPRDVRQEASRVLEELGEMKTF